jgi:hypothetical protein
VDIKTYPETDGAIAVNIEGLKNIVSIQTGVWNRETKAITTGKFRITRLRACKL